jgi:hypothetical protein
MEPQPNDLKAIRILYFAMLIGQVFFASIITVLVEAGFATGNNNSLITMGQVAVIVIAAVLVPASFFLFRKRLSIINPEEDLGGKLEKYRAALIIRMGLCQMPTMFATIVYFITGNHSFLWMIIILISNFLLIYPSNNKIIDSLQLNSSEQSSLGMN